MQLAFDKLYDDRYGYPGEFELHRCGDCDHSFLGAEFTDAELGRLYTAYYPRSKLNLEAWSAPPELNGFRAWFHRAGSGVFRWVPSGVRILDIGCGTGETLAYHSRRGCEAHGIEADENIKAVAERFNLNLRVGLFRAADYPHNYFDVITLDQVVEHAADPVLMLTEAAAVLKPGGLLLISTPNSRSLMARVLGRYWVHFHTPYHLQLFSERSLRKLATRSGFQIEWRRHITHPFWYHFQWMHLITRPLPGIASTYWNRTLNASVAQRCAEKLFALIGRVGFNHTVALTLDALKLGDNLVVALRKR